ncbi:hypothetical protein J4416_02950 [Candidatus Pacearchaeota archaeon]|nr:hypothetical protein [Candidatus Pacearchaeota archaeon]
MRFREFYHVLEEEARVYEGELKEIVTRGGAKLLYQQSGGSKRDTAEMMSIAIRFVDDHFSGTPDLDKGYYSLEIESRGILSDEDRKRIIAELRDLENVVGYCVD